MEPSPEQQQIISFAANNHNENMAIIAYAGSGKTSTLVEVAKSKPRTKTMMAVAFAKPNTLDFERVMPANVESGTLHSFGLRACKQLYGKCRVQTNKTYKIVDALKIKVTKDFPQLPRVLGFVKSQGMVPFDTLDEDFVCSQPTIHSLYEDTEQNWRYIFDRLGVTSIFDDDKMIEICRKALALSIKLALPGKGLHPMLDFDDMIYIPACFSNGEGFQKPSVLLVDEAQDLNLTQHECIKQISQEGNSHCQVILVGDPNQAIYAFRGADADSFNNLIELFDCRVFDLSYTFRSDRLITNAAQYYVPHMQTYSEKAGIVKEWNTWQAQDIKQGDAILCRNTAPLVGIFYKLLKHGLPAKIKGTEIGKGLISILKSKVYGQTVREIAAGIDKWYMEEENKATRQGHAHRVGILLEQSQILHVILQRVAALRPDSAGYKEHMIDQLEQMFTDDVPKICLATIHKAKGLEWDRVFLLDRWLMPSKYAKQDWELQQEDNLMYVAITRAKHELHYVNSRNIED
jgi:superfamily I DNA/RNA helicase